MLQHPDLPLEPLSFLIPSSLHQQVVILEALVFRTEVLVETVHTVQGIFQRFDFLLGLLEFILRLSERGFVALEPMDDLLRYLSVAWKTLQSAHLFVR